MDAKIDPQFDVIRFMDDFKRSVNFYNSYGLEKKTHNKMVVPLSEKNQ